MKKTATYELTKKPPSIKISIRVKTEIMEELDEYYSSLPNKEEIPFSNFVIELAIEALRNKKDKNIYNEISNEAVIEKLQQIERQINLRDEKYVNILANAVHKGFDAVKDRLNENSTLINESIKLSKLAIKYSKERGGN